MMTLAAMAALTALTAGAAARQERAAAPTEATAPRDGGEPIMAIVSIKTQRVTFYDADAGSCARRCRPAHGRETPAGVFAVIEKDKDHHSTLYDDAWMPNMQRITWNGIALHGGPLPGYAASHGCVRMPFGFAEKLFEKTRIGMRIIISPDNAEPVEFSHPALFVPKAEAVAAAPSRAETLAREAAEAAGTVDETKKIAATAARETASLTSSLRKLQGLKTRADAELAYAARTLAAAKTDEAKARPRTSSKRPPPRPRMRGRSSTPPGLRRNRSSTPPPPQRTPPRRPDEEGRHRQGGERGEARARAGLGLHQPRDEKALRAAQHAQAGAGRGRRGV